MGEQYQIRWLQLIMVTEEIIMHLYGLLLLVLSSSSPDGASVGVLYDSFAKYHTRIWSKQTQLVAIYCV